MANSVIDYDDVFLLDRWPGNALSGQSTNINPAAASVSNVSTPVCPVGTKIILDNAGTTTRAGVAGKTVLIYLKVGTQDTTAIAAGSTVGQASATDPYTVSNKVSEQIGTLSGLQAIAICAVADGKYAFFWCGGVAPTDFIPDFDGTDHIVTDDSINAGGPFIGATGAAATAYLVLRAMSAAAAEFPLGHALRADGA